MSLQIQILRRTILKDLSGASGIDYFNESLYIVADNLPFLYQLSMDGQIIQKIPLLEDAENMEVPILKAIKPDFEAMTLWEKDDETTIFIFGSGSRFPQRANCFRIEINENNKVTEFDLRILYTQLQADFALGDEQLNLEATLIFQQNLYLFNRADNQVFSCGMNDFLAHLTNQKPIKFRSHRFDLPELNGIKAGISGACTFPDSPYILISASLENTSNWIDDGEVLGSYLCLITLEEELHPRIIASKLLEEQNGILPLKIESLTVTRKLSEKHYEIMLVSDSDGGDSELLTLNIEI